MEPSTIKQLFNIALLSILTIGMFACALGPCDLKMSKSKIVFDRTESEAIVKCLNGGINLDNLYILDSEGKIVSSIDWEGIWTGMGGENDWISAEISEDNYSVTIKVKANDSGEQRMAKVFLLAIEGDRGASVKVVQNP